VIDMSTIERAAKKTRGRRIDVILAGFPKQLSDYRPDPALTSQRVTPSTSEITRPMRLQRRDPRSVTDAVEV
jgi:hypothetical protein